MISGIESRPASDDATAHADWLELKALAAGDENSSFHDFVAEVRRGGSTDAVQESIEALVDWRGETSERVADVAFDELEDRVRAGGAGYPFSIERQAIQLESGAFDAGSTYVFLLLLSRFGARAAKDIGVHPERDFEDISLAAAEG